MNKKNLIFQIYLYLVCYTAIIAITISLITGIFAIIRLFSPEFTMNSYQWKSFQSFELYKKDFLSRGGSASKEISDEELKRLYEKEKDFILKIQKREAFKSIIRSFLIILIFSLIFFFHWRIAKKITKED